MYLVHLFKCGLTSFGFVKKYGNNSSRSVDMSMSSFFLCVDVNLIFSFISAIFFSFTTVDLSQSTSFAASESEYGFWFPVLFAAFSVSFTTFFMPFLSRKFFIPITSQPEFFFESYSNSYFARSQKKTLNFQVTNFKRE